MHGFKRLQKTPATIRHAKHNRPKRKRKKKLKPFLRYKTAIRKHRVAESSTSTTFTVSSFAIGNNLFTNSNTNTLDMITTPWSTEDSFNCDVKSAQSKKRSICCWKGSSISTSTQPLSTESSGRLTSDIKSTSRITWTVLSNPDSIPASVNMPVVKQDLTNDDDEISTWTLETYTSTGLLTDDNKSEASIKVKYPWSPATNLSTSNLTEAYPSSVSVGQRSWDLLSQLCPINCKKILMKYVVLGPAEADSCLDQIMVKRFRQPLFKKKSKNI